MAIIYEPKGRANEYCKLAVNLYKGCSHGCVYCYAPQATMTNRDEFYNNPVPRKNILELLKKECSSNCGNGQYVLLSFSSDPYQQINEKYGITREAIKLLKSANYRIVILTKGGGRAEKDFDILDKNDYIGATLTFLNKSDSLLWEPNAAPPEERIEMLIKAKQAGIGTWASLEPVIDPEQTLEIIRLTHEFVDIYKVGKLNYHPLEKTINWAKFAEDVKRELTRFQCRFYIKNDLRKYIQRTAF